MRSGDLVAVHLPPGPGWLEVVRRAWDAGAALLPVDSRLAAAEVAALLKRARPTLVLDRHGERRPPDGVPPNPACALVMATSGVTGEPRLVELSRKAVEAAVRASAEAVDAGPGDGWLSCLPPSHIGGLLVLLRGLILGCPVAVEAGFDPAAVAAAGRRSEMAFTALVPTMLLRMLEGGHDISGYRRLLVGGAPADAVLRGRRGGILQRCVFTYGQTQSCGGVVYDGRPLRGVRIRVDAAGEIQLQGATMMCGYRLDPEATSLAFTADGWLRTGDAGRLGADGALEVEGRLDDLIISGGEKVWPAEVERVLRLHPAVRAVAVVGRPDPEWGSRVVAVVEPEPAVAMPTLQGMREFASEHLARHKAPRELVVVDRLPVGSLGKVRRSELLRRMAPMP